MDNFTRLSDARAMRAMGAPLNTPVEERKFSPRSRKKIDAVMGATNAFGEAILAWAKNLQDWKNFNAVCRAWNKLESALAKAYTKPKWIEQPDGSRELADDEAVAGRLEAVRRAPSIYDLTIQLLHRRGLGIDTAILERDVSMPHVGSDSVLNAWLSVYQDPTRFWELYELAEKLVDFEDYFRRWRFNHVTTVERIIGFKRGTGGSSGVSYLRKMLDVVLFPELWQVRTQL